MIDYQRIAYNLKNSKLDETKEPSLKSYLQSISETLFKLRTSSKSDQRRVEIAQQHVREAKKHVRRLEERVAMLEEQVQMLEEKTQKRITESKYSLYSLSGETPKDIADKIKSEVDLNNLNADNFKEIVDKYLDETGAVFGGSDYSLDWEEAIWAELTSAGAEMEEVYEDKKWDI